MKWRKKKKINLNGSAHAFHPQDQPQIGRKMRTFFISLLRPKTTFYCWSYNFSTLLFSLHCYSFKTARRKKNSVLHYETAKQF
jgi:hypothetical protein